jgi:hypothetical protein
MLGLIPSTWYVIAILIAVGIPAAHAAPPIAGGDLPGRERERFVEPPVGRAYQQQPLALPEWRVLPAERWCRDGALRHSRAHRSTRRGGCQPR